MKPDDAAKLLGGYSTGTLTEAERQALFDAALRDQDLFNSLADEEALKDLLDDPAARQRLLAALEEPRPSRLAGIAAWFRRPMAWAAAGSLAAAALLVTLFIRTGPPPAVEQVAMKTERQAPAPPAVGRRDEAASSIRPEAVKAKLPEALPKPMELKPAESMERKEAAESAPEFEARRQVAGQVAVSEPPPPPAAPPPPTAVTELPAQVALSKAPPAPSTQADVARPPAGSKARELYYLAQGPTSLQFARSTATEESARVYTKRRAANEAAPAMKAAAGPAGIRCMILKAGPDGRYAESDPAGPFHSGDQVRISVEANENGFLYLLSGKPAGNWALLFQGQVRPRTRYIVPDKDAIQLEGPSGEIRILAAFSRTPLPQPSLVGRDERRLAVTAPEADRLAAAFRLKSDDLNLLVDKDTQERSIYAVSPQPESDPSVVLEIPMRW